MKSPKIVVDNSKPKNFFEAMQNAIINRYAAGRYGRNEPVVYEFTQDRAMLHQYYLLRERMYKTVHHLDRFDGSEDLYDKLSYVLIARRGNLCLGGARLTIREADEMWDLPMETDQFNLRERFTNLPLNKVKHGEISRFAVMEDCGDENVPYSLCKMIYEKSVQLGAPYVFAKSPLKLARNWRMVARSVGAKRSRICDEVQVPYDPDLPEFTWYVVLCDATDVIKVQPEVTDVEIAESNIVSLVE